MRKHSRVVLVGLGFGVEFIPIYQQHPAVDLHGICRRDKSELKVIGDHFNIKNRYDDYQEVLKDPLVDFVHINSPIGDHGWMSIEALKSGKHVICTVPMATVIAECEEIVALVKATGLKYMMAETVVYSREFLFIKEMYECGDLGDIQFMKASHLQDMEGWPDYWKKMIPMHYATHVVSPVLGLVNGCAEYVSCFGSGSMNEEIRQLSGNPFAVESCHIKIKDMDLSAQVWRFLYDTARQYTESFDVYGTKQSFEWGLVEGDEHVIHTAKKPENEIPSRINIPDFAHLLPPEIRSFTKTIQDDEHLSFLQGGGHGGSHPHMVHEFVTALAEDREPWPNAVKSANWTCVGICAHESAMKGGERVRLPEFTIESKG